MAKYAIHDFSGNIIRMIECDAQYIDHQLSEGEMHTECNADPHDKIDMVERKVIKQQAPVNPMTIPPPAVSSYIQERRRAYPSVESQLDMLWHAMDTGVLPKVEPLYAKIKAVKLAIPKRADPTQDNEADTEIL